MSLRRSFDLIFLLIFSVFAFGQKIESVLNSGEIFKIAIPQSGIFKIDLQYLNDQNISFTNANYIQIFGQRGGMLPEPTDDVRMIDLVEFPLFKVGFEDGSFDGDDYFLFYADGADIWKNAELNVDYQKNIYDENNYVFLIINGRISKEIELVESLKNSEYSTSIFDELQRFEEDKINPLGLFPITHGSGQNWYGDEFSNLREKDYSDQFDFEGIDLSEPMRIKSEFISRSNAITTYQICVDGNTFEQSLGSVRVGDVEAIHARTAIIEESLRPSIGNPQISISYPQVASTSQGWLDYIQLEFREDLFFSGKPFVFRDKKSLDYDISEFVIGGALDEGIQVWNITIPENPVHQELNSSRFSYESNDELQSFTIFDSNGVFARPGQAEKIENQNLRGIVDADMVIVYHRLFETAALKLAQHRTDHSELLVEAVEISKIYNEFSSGRQDPTAIRDFAKMIYDRSENFKYLLLFGDGSYDFRGINKELPNQSLVPTYETKETLDPLAAFPSDDYFAQLDEGEGVNLRGDLDIAVGRLPARTVDEADNLVNKIVTYDSDSRTLGEWRSRIAFLADDEDSNLHLNDADEIAKNVSKQHPIFNQKKIYWDAFPQESTPGGNRYPAANQQLNTDIQNGLLVINYLGHGGPKGWSQERVLNLDDIARWSNNEKLPLFITATCSFTGFDDPSLTTAGEATIHNPSGGAIALFTTVRSVYASQNFRLTKAVFDTLFTKVDGEYMTIGEVMRRAKNTRVSDIVNARKFFLIGDPAMKLAIPRYSVETLEFNNKAVNTEMDTIGALQPIKVKSAIRDVSGEVNTSFNGEAFITLFDKASTLRTLRNDPGSFEKSFELQKNVLFRGRAKVTNGEFEFAFIVPLDIDYEFGNGRLSYYAIDNDGIDASGYFEDFVIGGTAENAISDNDGPEITIKLNSENFESGDQTNSRPIVLASLFDQSGINVSNVSIGHEIIGFVDEDSRTTTVLNDKYTSEIDDFTNGSLSYRLEELEVGRHTLTIRAFDILNNPGESTIEFEVAENVSGFLQNVIAFPNPFGAEVNFSVQNELGEIAEITLNIYDVKGRLIQQFAGIRQVADGAISTIKWSGTNHSGNLTSGLYLYEVLLQGLNSEKSLKSRLKKIVVLK